MIILRQKKFSSEGEKSNGMSTGKKVALGVGGTALAAGAAFAGARRGMFGVNAALRANNKLAMAGQKLSNIGMTGIGEKMMMSGAEGYGAARGLQYANKLKAAGKYDATTIENKAAAYAQKHGDHYLGRILGGVK